VLLLLKRGRERGEGGVTNLIKSGDLAAGAITRKEVI